MKLGWGEGGKRLDLSGTGGHNGWTTTQILNLRWIKHPKTVLKKRNWDQK